MTGVRRSFGKGGYHSGEQWMVVTPSARRPGCPLVVVVHGAGGSGWYYAADTIRMRWMNMLARSGMVVIAADLGTVTPNSPIDGWGSPRQVQGIDEVVAWGESEWGCDVERVCLIGDSAGGAGALNWARANSDQVGAVALRTGLTDIESVYQGGEGNTLLVQLIEDAYGGDWPSAREASDPALNTEELVPIADRLRFYYSDNDSLIPTQGVLDTAEAIGCKAISIGSVDHNPYPTWPEHQVSAWMWSVLRGAQ